MILLGSTANKTCCTEGCMGEQTSLKFDLTFGDVLVHKLVQTYYFNILIYPLFIIYQNELIQTQFFIKLVLDLDLKFYLFSNNQTRKGIYYILETGGYFFLYHGKECYVKFNFSILCLQKQFFALYFECLKSTLKPF